MDKPCGKELPCYGYAFIGFDYFPLYSSTFYSYILIPQLLLSNVFRFLSYFYQIERV